MTEPRHEGMSNERLKHLWAAAAVEFRITNRRLCVPCSVWRVVGCGLRSRR